MGGDFNNPLISTGIFAYVDFTVDASAAPNATSALSLTRADLNEGQVASTAVDGVFTVVSLLYGDVTGNGTLGGYDASWVLEHVVNGLLEPPVDVTFPIENTAPVWATLPLTEEDADAVADVDTTDGYIAATDASLILQRAVGLITSFPVEGATAPSFDPPSFGHMLTASASSERPGAQITVTLTASEAAELYSCELLLSFDSALLRPIDVSLASMEHGGQQPLLVQRERGDQLAIAFASSRPVDQSGLVLEVTFQTERGIHRAASGSVRASHLRLNGARLNPDFIYTFHNEPYQFQLMANYPNPFNPETWIPFELSSDADVTVRIYGLDGEIVRTLDLGYQPMGEYRARESAAYWDGRNEIGERVASGLYVYELQAGEQRAVRRMVISK
ncbi:MAG TPA: hypothetical protein EYQ27_14405 [Gemmatimonadetes bacterium]|nr:hypothetical protein [Gemmatimonadota bacterium]